MPARLLKCEMPGRGRGLLAKEQAAKGKIVFIECIQCKRIPR